MMDHENCHHLLGSLSEFVDGSLETKLCTEIERHLAGCDNCQVVIDSLRKTIYLYHVTAQQSPAVPDEVRMRLFRRLHLDEFIQKNS